MEIGLYQFNTILTKATTFSPSKGVIPLLAAFSSYNPDIRRMARESLLEFQEKIVKDLNFPKDDRAFLDNLKESAIFAAQIYNEIHSNKNITENDVIFFFNLLMGTGVKGRFYAWRIWQDKFLTKPYFKTQVGFFTDERKLSFADQYLGASISKRRLYARFFKNLLKKIKSRPAVLAYYARLFKQNRHPDPFLCNLNQDIINVESIVETELDCPDPEVRKNGLFALAMIEPFVDQDLLLNIIETDPDSGVRIAALNIIEAALPDTYSGLTPVILQLLYKKKPAESMAAFRALVPSLTFPPHKLMERVKVNRPKLLKEIWEEIASFSRITFLIAQDLSRNPTWYMNSGIPAFRAMVKGLAQKEPQALSELLSEVGETQLLRKLKAGIKKETSFFQAILSEELDRMKKAKMAAQVSSEKSLSNLIAAQKKEFEKEAPFQSIQFQNLFFSKANFFGVINHSLSFLLDDSCFEDCTLSSTHFIDSSFKRVVFYKADLTHCLFQSCCFDHAVFIQTRAESSIFQGCSFKKAVFSQSDFSFSDVKNSIFAESTFSKTRFEHANLSGATFVAAQFSQVTFENAFLDQTDFFPVKQNDCIGPFHDTMEAKIGYSNKTMEYSSVFKEKIPKIQVASMDKICHLIFASFTQYGKQRFMVKNRNALLAACDILQPKTYDLFEIIPLLIHENLSFPGYNAHQENALHGICEYIPSVLSKETFCKYLGGKVEFKRPQNCHIEGLYTIGSTGTIAQNASSDIDYWVCINETGYVKSMKKALEEKLEKLEIWAEDFFRAEIHFFIVEIQKARENNFGHADIHGSGSAQGVILKDEFYRTMVLVAGKLPLWTVLPPCICRRHYGQINTLLSKNPRFCRYIDLGDIQSIPKKEYYGALIWQIFKGIGNAFKSIIKMGLIEKYYYETLDDPLLCNQFKDNWVNTQTQISIFNNDPYYALLNTLIDHYNKIFDTYAADLIKLCFVIQLSNLNPSDIENTHFGIKKTIVGQMMAQGHWNDKNVFKLGDLKKWHFSNVTKISEIIKNHFIAKYKELNSSMGNDGEKTNLISPPDKTILVKKMYVQFSKQPGKIENLLLVVKNKTYFQELYLRHEKPGGGWNLVHRSGKIGEKREEVLKTAVCIEQIAAWMINNRLYDENTIIHMAPNSTYVTSDDINHLFTSMNSLFLPYDRDRINFSSFLSKARIQFVFICINFYKSRTCKKIKEGIIVHSNSWGEMFYKPFSDKNGFDSIQSLDLYLKKELNLSELPANRSYFYPKRFRHLSLG